MAMCCSLPRTSDCCGSMGRRNEVQRFDSTITALASLPDGGLAVALDGREISIRGGKRDGKRWTEAAGKSFCAVNALSVTPKGKLLATDGSATQPYDKWCHDLMALGRTGRLLELDPAPVRRANLLPV